jgi:hypothetical protein
VRVIVEQLVEWRLAGETEVLGGNLPQRQFVHHKSQLTRPGIICTYDLWVSNKFTDRNHVYKSLIHVTVLIRVASSWVSVSCRHYINWICDFPLNVPSNGGMPVGYVKAQQTTSNHMQVIRLILKRGTPRMEAGPTRSAGSNLLCWDAPYRQWMYRSTFSWPRQAGGEKSASRPGRFTSRKELPVLIV